MSTETRSDNQIFSKWLGIKFCVLFIMIVYFVGNYINVRNISPWLLFFYVVIMFMCSFAFFLTIFPIIRRIAYFIFGISLALLLLMNRFNSEISNQLRVIDCLEVGQIWDPEQKICRNDCLKWTKEEGCIPLK